jgi:hypothetical protein
MRVGRATQSDAVEGPCWHMPDIPHAIHHVAKTFVTANLSSAKSLSSDLRKAEVVMMGTVFPLLFVPSCLSSAIFRNAHFRPGQHSSLNLTYLGDLHLRRREQLRLR